MYSKQIRGIMVEENAETLEVSVADYLISNRVCACVKETWQRHEEKGEEEGREDNKEG